VYPRLGACAHVRVYIYITIWRSVGGGYKRGLTRCGILFTSLGTVPHVEHLLGEFMANATRTGLATVTFALKRICEVVRKFGPSLNAALDVAVTAGHITSTQRDSAVAFITSAQAACDIFRAASGY
jgi:hypothetical protein